jgi:hypothetical protein
MIAIVNFPDPSDHLRSTEEGYQIDLAAKKLGGILDTNLVRAPNDRTNQAPPQAVTGGKFLMLLGIVAVGFGVATLMIFS